MYVLLLNTIFSVSRRKMALPEVYTEILVVVSLSTLSPLLNHHLLSSVPQLQTLLLKVCSYFLDIFLIYKEVYVCSCYTYIFAHISVKKWSLLNYSSNWFDNQVFSMLTLLSD